MKLGFYNILRNNLQKQFMQSRTRKYRKSFDNYEQAIQKQLNDDFQVYEYLTQNKLQGNNIDEYLKLYDSLQVTKNDKKKRFESLKVNYVQMSTDILEVNLESSKVQDWDGVKEEFLTRYQQAQIKTSNQIQVKNNLWKQILQTKKSLNLLKGDIGHLISRNQSAKLLQSKISKVKIVADDQLKRVSLAFVKDKDQLKVRGQMQRKFNKKLKNVSMFQDSTLNRLKKSYIGTMVKKRQIHDRLNYIEKVGASINQSGDKQKMKNETNKNTLQLYSNFVKISNLINKMPEKQKKYGNTSIQIHQFVNWLKIEQNWQEQGQNDIFCKPNQKSSNLSYTKQINYQDLQMITEQKLKEFEKIIKIQHARVLQDIQKNSSEYDMQMKRNQQMVFKLEQCNEQIEKIEISILNEIGMKYVVTRGMRQDYFRKLRRFIQFLKTIFTLLEYIQKNLNYSALTFQIKRKGTHDSEKSFFCQDNTSNLNNSKTFSDAFNLKVPEQSKTLISSQKSIIWTNRNYISELYKIYYILVKQQQSDEKLDNIQDSIFYDLQYDIQNWLALIKNYFINGGQNSWPVVYHKQQKEQRNTKIQKQSSKIRDSRISQLKTLKIGMQTEEEQLNQAKQEDQYNFENYKRHHTVHRQENIMRYHSYSASSLSNHSRYAKVGTVSINRTFGNLSNPTTTKIINLHKLKKCSQHKKAQRIKFLEDVDKDYYKMLKSTLKMEKQNTRKNYQFLRTFKRAKYSSRDEILQEKRFECSFSMLFAGNKNKIMNQSSKLKNKKSLFYKSQSFEKRISKLNESRKLLDSSTVIKSSDSTIELNNKAIRQLKQNVRKFKDRSQKLRTQSSNQRNLSIQMKDIINLL